MSIVVERRGHSCVVVRAADRAFVIDPGGYSDLDAALDGVEAVLVTHEHPDHVAPEPVAASGLPVWGPQGVLDALRAAGASADLLHPVTSGDEIMVAGRSVRVLGERHEPIHPDVPVVANVAYLVDGRLLHPGDAYPAVPDGVRVAVALTPVAGPWLRIREVVDWVRSVGPERVVPIHDAPLSEAGRTLATTWIERLCDTEIVSPGPGEPVEV